MPTDPWGPYGEGSTHYEYVCVCVYPYYRLVRMHYGKWPHRPVITMHARTTPC